MKNRQEIDVFISHHTSSCLPITQAVCNALENSGIRCWYAPRDTQGAYAGSIVSAINESKIFILVLNRESSFSQDVLNEINLAVERIRNGENLAILPFQISADSISDDAKYYIGRMHWIDAITPPMDARIQELKSRVMVLLQKTPSQDSFRQAANDPVNQQILNLKSSNLLPNRNFICRNRELDQLRQELDLCNKLFLQGMGGIGKSELAKAYALQNRSFYSTVIFTTYQTNLRDLIIYDTAFALTGISRTYDSEGIPEDDDTYFMRKLQHLQAYTDEHTLIIIDNFDTTQDEYLEAFLNGAYTVIFTTRNDFEEWGLPVINLTEFDSESDLLALFNHYYRHPVAPQHQQTVIQIIDLVNGHTLAVELIAKYMLHQHMHPDKMLELLRQNGITAMEKGIVHHGFSKATSVYENIQQMLSLYKLTQHEQYILSNLALMPLSGVDFVTFGDLCELEDFYAVDELIRKSWIRHDLLEDTISLHPLVRDVILKENAVSLTDCAVLLRNLTQKLEQLWGLPVKDKLCYGNLGKCIYERFPVFDIVYLDTYIAIAFGVTLLEQYDLGRQILTRCLDVCRAAYGDISAQMAQIYYRLGDNELHRNNYEEAIEFLNKAIEILEIAAPESGRLAYMIKFLCWTRLGWLTDHQETERLLHKSNRILRSQDPVDPLQLASQDAAYATVYYLLGQYEQALSYAQSSYETFFRFHGDLHGDTLAPMGIKARILSKLNRREESILLCQKVIDLQKQLVGENHQRVLNRYESLAEIYENLGDIPNAVQTLDMLLALLEKKKDSTSPFFRRIQQKRSALSND